MESKAGFFSWLKWIEKKTPPRWWVCMLSFVTEVIGPWTLEKMTFSLGKFGTLWGVFVGFVYFFRVSFFHDSYWFGESSVGDGVGVFAQKQNAPVGERPTPKSLNEDVRSSKKKWPSKDLGSQNRCMNIRTGLLSHLLISYSGWHGDDRYCTILTYPLLY